MAIKTPTELKAYFETGDIPTQTQFEDLIDSTYKGYKVYTAILSQSGTSDPTSIVLENTLGFTPTYQYSDVGEYRINSVAGFITNKTVVILGQMNNQLNGSVIVDTSRINITSQDLSSGTPFGTDGLLANTLLEIRIYN